MRLRIGREHMDIIPENDMDRAYIEDALKLKKNGDSLTLKRRNIGYHGLGNNANNGLNCLRAVKGDKDGPRLL